MVDIDTAMKSHLGNLSRAIGHDVGKYQYILSSDDIIKSYYESKHDLPYPLRKEVKRDRYIYNADGLQKDLEDIVNNAIQAADKELADMVSDDIVNMVYAKINGVTSAVGGKTKVRSSAASAFGRALAKGLMNGLSKVYEELRNPD